MSDLATRLSSHGKAATGPNARCVGQHAGSRSGHRRSQHPAVDVAPSCAEEVQRARRDAETRGSCEIAKRRPKGGRPLEPIVPCGRRANLKNFRSRWGATGEDVELSHLSILSRRPPDDADPDRRTDSVHTGAPPSRRLAVWSCAIRAAFMSRLLSRRRITDRILTDRRRRHHGSRQLDVCSTLVRRVRLDLCGWVLSPPHRPVPHCRSTVPSDSEPELLGKPGTSG